MSAQDFTEELRRYLEGFVSGVQARRAAEGLKPLGAKAGESAKAGQMSQQAAMSFIAELKDAGRYQANVY